MGKPKVLGIGAPRFAKPEFEELQKVADVYWFKPEVSEQVHFFFVGQPGMFGKGTDPKDIAGCLDWSGCERSCSSLQRTRTI